MWPRTWKDTAENRPMQMNWLRLTPMAMKHDSVRKNYRKDTDADDLVGIWIR